MSVVLAHMQELTRHFGPPMCPLERFLLRYGSLHQTQALPKGIERMPYGECFENATSLAIERGWLYAEGIALHKGLIPMTHGWCLDKNVTVVDPTWNHPEDNEYFGIALTVEEVVREQFQWGYHGILDSPNGPNLDFMKRWAATRPQKVGCHELGKTSPRIQHGRAGSAPA